MNDIWIQTFTGKQFHFLNPKVNEIDIQDIAHALSNICRYTGHCNKFYSVAQHSILMSQLINKEDAIAALLHDATEAYIHDFASPLKQISEFNFYKKMEKKIDNCIKKKFGIKYNNTTKKIIKQFDILLMVTEARQLGLMTKNWKHYNIIPLDIIIHPLLPNETKRLFLNRFKELQSEK